MKVKKNIISLGSALLLCAALSGCGVQKLDPQDYCEVQVIGAEGYATASLAKNYSSLEYAATANLSKKADEFDKLQAALFADTIRFEITSDKTENLKNGDVIEVDVTYDKDIAKKYGFAFKKDSFKYKVSGLEEAKPLDPFEGIEIEYDGFSPKADFELDFSGCSDVVRSYIKFDYEDKKVGNGDTIQVKASVKNENGLLSQGYVLGNDTKDFIVSGIQEGNSIDPFEGLVLDYEGISPNARIKFDLSGCNEFVKNNVSFSSSNSNYANGDTAKISISYSTSKAEENGIVFTQEEKDYTVSGVAEFPDSDEGVDFSSIDEQFKSQLESELSKQDYYVGGICHGRSMFADVYSDDEYVVTALEYKPVKKIYFKSKNPANSSIVNNHFIIWEITMTAEKTALADGWSPTHDDVAIGSQVSVTYLADTYIQNIAVNSDGSLNDSQARNIQYDVFYKSAWGKRNRDSNVLNVTVDSICEKWRSSNASDFNISIEDI